MKIGATNNVSFGMAKFAPAMKDFINQAEKACDKAKIPILIYPEHLKCLQFLDKIFPGRTLNIKTGIKRPKNFIERIFPKKTDIVYLDGKGILSVHTTRGESLPERLIACSNALYATFCTKKPHIELVPTGKFIGTIRKPKKIKNANLY